MSDACDALRWRRSVARLHALGPRALGEFLAELAAERMLRGPIEDKLEAYAELTPAMIGAVQADRWPPTLFAVPCSLASNT